MYVSLFPVYVLIYRIIALRIKIKMYMVCRCLFRRPLSNTMCVPGNDYVGN